MFTREQVIEAFYKINSGARNREKILQNCPKGLSEAAEEDYIRAFSKKLVTDEVMAYINANTFEAIDESHDDETVYTLCCVGWYGRPLTDDCFEEMGTYIATEVCWGEKGITLFWSGSSDASSYSLGSLAGGFFDPEFQKMFPEDCRDKWGKYELRFSQHGIRAKAERLVHKIWDYDYEGDFD